MYRALQTTCLFPSSAEHGRLSNEANKKVVKDALERFLKDGKIDGSAMRDNWFPQISTNVFISHSHSDEEKALKLASWLQEFGLTSFVDSAVWGYGDELLKQIDNAYCLNPDGDTYSYEKRNGSTSHVHMMISIALAMMIDTAECVIFLNTPNAITSRDAVSKTRSPWLLYELGMINLVRRRPAKDHRPKEVIETFAAKKAERLQIEYSVDLMNLAQLDAEHFNELVKRVGTTSWENIFPLDALYEIAPET